jgi:hypothetical protein
MGNAKLNLIESMRRLLYFHTTNTTSESSLVHDIRNLIGGELTETMGPVDRDPPHHAPSETTTPITPPDECFAVRNTGYGACEATIHRDKNTMNVSIPCGDEALTKRERFAMEFMSDLIRKSPYCAGTTSGTEQESLDSKTRQRLRASGAVAYADALIAELAKERT